MQLNFKMYTILWEKETMTAIERVCLENNICNYYAFDQRIPQPPNFMLL